jgi:hypothetical protein
MLGSFVLSGVNAQQIELKEKDNGAVEIVTDFSQNTSNHYLFKSKAANIDDYYTVDPVRTWGHTQEWSNPQINFSPSGISQAVGDLDGDGTTDFIRTYTTWDERTEDLSDQVSKTLVFLGSGNQTDPDHIIYDQLIPIGDLAGTGQSQLVSQNDAGVTLYQFTSTDYSTSSISIPELENLEIPFSNYNLIRDDIDGNSIDDIIVNSENTLYVGLINSTLENSTVLEFDVSSQIGLQSYSITNLEYVKWDDTPYVLTTVRDSFTNNQLLVVMELDITTESITHIQTSKLSLNSVFTDISLAEDNNGFPNVIVSGTENETDSTGGAYTKLYTMSGDTMLYNQEPVDLGDVEGFAVGDLNGNGWSDLIISSDNEYSFATINPADTSLSIEGVIGTPAGSNQFLSVDGGFNPQGDLNNDGNDDVQFYVSNEEVFGQLRIEGVGSSGTVDYANPTEYLYDAETYRTTRIEGTYVFGDLTGNGLDDYGLIVSDGLSGRMDIYEGGSDGTTPNSTIDLAGFVQFITSGDFNVDGREDILMLISINVGTEEEPERSNELHFYELGAENPYHVIKGQDYQPGLDNYNNFIGTIANAGDINDDGLDDILVGAPFNGLNPIGVYFGGSSISLNPDHEISFPEVQNLSYGFGWGGTLQGGFDFNGDGVDDFLVGNNNEFDENERPEGANFNNDGAIHIFEGEQGLSSFAGGSDVTLKSDTMGYNTNTWYWAFGFNEVAYGDFNGDGDTDIAIKPFRHIEFNDINEGRPSIHIYTDFDGFDGRPDQILPLLEEIHQPEAVSMGSDTTAFSGRAEMAAVPDINGDGADELLYIGPSYERNGSLFFGGDTLAHSPDAVLEAPNQSVGFNTNGNFINRQYRMSIGEISEAGVSSVLVWQQGDTNFMDTPAYMYELTQMAVSTEEPISSNKPEHFSLEQNYPNPFNPTTNIQFEIPKATDVSLKVYNVLGQEVMTILNDFKQAGTHTAKFDAGNLASGVYIYQLKAGSVNLQRKMMLIK